MALESATYIGELVETNPSGSDAKKQGDDHIRLIKAVLKNTFPGVSSAIEFGTWAQKTSITRAITGLASQDVDDDGKWIEYTISGLVQYSLLAAATAGDGFFQIIQRIDSSNDYLVLEPAGSELINGLARLHLGPNEAVVLVCNGSAWRAVHSLEARPGTIKMTASVVSEPGWLNCNGQAVSRTGFVRLFEAITVRLTGTRTLGSAVITGLSSTLDLHAGMFISGSGIPAGATIAGVNSSTEITMSDVASSSGTSEYVFAPYGIGDGSTSFNLPDLRGRVPITEGQGSGLTNREMGQVLGAETHQHEVPVGSAPAGGHIQVVGNADWPHGTSGISRPHNRALGDDTNTVSTLLSGATSSLQPSLGVRALIRM